MVTLTSSNNGSVSCNVTGEKCTKDLTENTEVWRTLMAVYLGAILFLSLAFNGTLCLMFYKKSHLLSVSNCFVLNLICCQLSMSLLVLPFSLFAVVSQDWIYTGHWCEIQGFVFTSAIVAQQLALLNISIDRNYAIMNSLRYPNVFTQTLCSILIAISWMFAVIVSVPPLLSSGMGSYVFHRSQFLCGLDWTTDENFLVVFSLMAFALPVLIQSFCYIKIFIAAVGHSKRSSKVKPWTSRPSRATNDLRSDSSTCSSDYSEEVYQNSVECKAVKTIFIIALAYSISWLPYFVVSFLSLKGENVNPNFSAAAICCLFSSSILNPMIYAYMNRITRREIGRFVCGHSGVNDSDEAGSTSMSAYSAAWAQSKNRTKSNGALTNEMDTIMEETEVEESVFCEPRYENRLSVSKHKSGAMVKSPSTGGTRQTEKIIVKGERCIAIDTNKKPETNTVYSDSREIVVPEASGSNLEQNAIGKKAKESAWNIVKSEKFSEELRRSSKSDESYFAKGKRRRKRDCGSFLYFENNDQPDTRGHKKRDKEKKEPQRCSVDHVQSISVGKIPSFMKFRLSLNESDLKNVNKVTVKSNFEFENKAYEQDEDIPSHPSFDMESDIPSHPSFEMESDIPSHPSFDMESDILAAVTQPFENGNIIPATSKGECKNDIRYEKNRVLTSTTGISVVTKPFVSQTIIHNNQVSQRRVSSAPASLSLECESDTGQPSPLYRESSTPSSILPSR